MEHLFDIRGKVALVTGGGQGLGRMIAEAFVRAGAKTYVTSRAAETVEAAAREMSAHGACIGLAADMSTPEGATALAQRIAGVEPALHVLVNNAGKTFGAPIEKFPDKAWASVMSVNVQAPFTLVRDLLPLLERAGASGDPARVINIGSLAGSTAERLSAYSYSASKAAIHHLTRVLAVDLAPRGIAVNTIVPGYFPTKMTAHIRAEADKEAALQARVPLGRLGQANDIAGACLFLAGPASAYITGAELAVDGGLSQC
ncbi:3-oxoacyl-[acyl-carrier protein] reductase [alpha proteobacterium U9-1i]|nr:3-oxoacyl-[acyl-carrier protein] reductase [alpha proteobacterium U9-1i]